MKSDHYGPEMKAAIANGQVSEATLDAMVTRRLAQMFRFGMIDEVRSAKPLRAESDGAIARSIGEQCAVLLKNENSLLPLRAGEMHTIALIGPYAGAAHTGGGGSSMVKALYTVSPVDGIKHRAGSGVTVVYNDGADPVAAAAVAKSADVVLVMVGNKDGEGHDRPDLLLPKGQNALVSAVAAANPRTVVVLKTGGAVLMPWLNAVPAALEAWYPGEEDGNVVADLVFGDVNPSGKLPLTFPAAENFRRLRARRSNIPASKEPRLTRKNCRSVTAGTMRKTLHRFFRSASAFRIRRLNLPTLRFRSPELRLTSPTRARVKARKWFRSTSPLREPRANLLNSSRDLRR